MTKAMHAQENNQQGTRDWTGLSAGNEEFSD